MLKLQKIFNLGDDMQPTWATTTLLDKFYLFFFIGSVLYKYLKFRKKI